MRIIAYHKNVIVGCPKCEGSFEVPEDFGQATVGCPHCGNLSILTSRSGTEASKPMPFKEPRKKFLTVLFRFQGRLSRRAYWIIGMIRHLFLFSALLLTKDFVYREDGQPRPYEEITGEYRLELACWMLALLVYGWVGLTSRVQRWHDMDRSGKMALICPTLALASLIILIGVAPMRSGEVVNPVSAVTGFAGFFVGIGLFMVAKTVEGLITLFFPGTPQPNRFGQRLKGL